MGKENKLRNSSDLRRALLDLPHGLEVKLPRKLEKTIALTLQNPPLGYLRGANKEYRDFNKDNSLHILVYKNYLKAHIDKKNPIYSPIHHLIRDAKDVLGLLIGGFATTFLTIILISSLLS